MKSACCHHHFGALTGLFDVPCFPTPRWRTSSHPSSNLNRKAVIHGPNAEHTRTGTQVHGTMAVPSGNITVHFAEGSMPRHVITCHAGMRTCMYTMRFKIPMRLCIMLLLYTEAASVFSVQICRLLPGIPSPGRRSFRKCRSNRALSRRPNTRGLNSSWIPTPKWPPTMNASVMFEAERDES